MVAIRLFCCFGVLSLFPNHVDSIQINLGIIKKSIKAGTTLAHTTVKNLKEERYVVAVSGSVENYSSFTLRMEVCEIRTGYVNVPMQNVASGQKEAFASHKSGNLATGTWLRCTFKIKDDFVHFMYSAPYSFDLHGNTLAVAVCPQSSNDCQSMNAKKMYNDNKSFMIRHTYYNIIREISKCGKNFCIRGSMGTSHKPEIDLALFPTSFDDLAEAAKKSAVKERWDLKDYENFIKQ
ncbi:tereporin-Ca1-like [Clytia hemisphaerica]